MSIANHVREYLEQQGVDYQVLSHADAPSGMRLAEAAHVPGDAVAKGVLLEDDEGYLLAVVPATHRLRMGAVRKRLQRAVGLATEPEVRRVFSDCTPGAVPVVGAAYGLRMLVDDALCGRSDVYLDGGDHLAMLHLSGPNFDRLVADARCGSISRHV